MVSELLNARYQITGMVGTGSTSAVYRATDTFRPDRPEVAIKQFHFEHAFPHQDLRTLSLLSHPGIPKAYEAFYGSGCWHIVMDYVDGETLERCRKDCGGKLPVGEIAGIGLQLASILDEVHGHDLLYCDLKPQNILRTDTGKIVLVDFGLASDGRWMDVPYLTAPYAAPELRMGWIDSNRLADTYSLGIVLFELLFGHCNVEDARPTEEAEIRLLDAILKMLSWRPEKRLPSMMQVMRALLRV